ncbi:MAG: tRNA lysidine(34) synthetase TilS [Brumimicrobium sp.]
MEGKVVKYWVACSGGVDSVVLTYLLFLSNMKFGILHCNFHLREEDSNVDEQFVRDLAKELNVPIQVRQFNTKSHGIKRGLNTQLAARELRYNWFDEIINDGGIVFVAHHFDDQLETFFLQLRRGGSVRALAAMPTFRNGYLRPLLKYTKAELIELAYKNNWKWREDKSNESDNYTRNWYRHEVLPFLKRNTFPLEEVVPLVENFQSLLTFLKTLDIPNEINIFDWLQMPIWLKQHILSEHELGEFPAYEIDRLANTFKGKFIGNNKSQVWNEGTTLIFSKVKEEKPVKSLDIQKTPNKNIAFQRDLMFLDAEKIKGELSFRKWLPGDYFQPIGMKGMKTVAKFLRDRKVESSKKKDIYVLTDETERIIGIFRFGVAEFVKVREDTKTVLKVKLE